MAYRPPEVPIDINRVPIIGEKTELQQLQDKLDDYDGIIFGRQLEINGEQAHMPGIVETIHGQGRVITSFHNMLMTFARLSKIKPEVFFREMNNIQANEDYLEDLKAMEADHNNQSKPKL